MGKGDWEDKIIIARQALYVFPTSKPKYTIYLHAFHVGNTIIYFALNQVLLSFLHILP